ncbi:MAG: bifunctional imidazole glycerol-phosphate dehydratase/histidinol phosphatase [Bacteroidetes bacterium MedPE-SWsnd-G2]|nr:MAG: bifunctional imidazole glycerol-phosphate dehydratase/histidinol phosphatase [Bacteroidetes bacterium MedPE-SWsnd-G2]
MKKVLFIDRDGTIIEEPGDQQVDSFNKFKFYPGVFKSLSQISDFTDYEFVLVTNQDGLGTKGYPENVFWPIHNFMIESLENENIVFKEQVIDRTFAKDNANTRKPNTGLLNQYFSEEYNLTDSFVIGDRLTDVELAKNLGSKAILLNNNNLGDEELTKTREELEPVIALETDSWKTISKFLIQSDRSGEKNRNTNETKVQIKMNLDGTGESEIDTGIAFFDHMLDQIARHGQIDLKIKVLGDLKVDEHHTIEDTAIVLGQLFKDLLGDKRGIERYGFCLPMDDCLAQTAIDFGGRNWIEWDANFKREMIGQMPTEMFFHFFKSFTDGAACNLNVKAEGVNEHHKIEAIFKSFAKSLKMAVNRDYNKMLVPSTKGVL